MPLELVVEGLAGDAEVFVGGFQTAAVPAQLGHEDGLLDGVQTLGQRALRSGCNAVGTCGHLSRRRHAGHHLAEARSEEHTSELQSLMRTSYAVFCLKKKNTY